MVAELLRVLLSHHGPQGWWPADDEFEIVVGAVLVQRTTWRNAELALQNLRRAGLLAIDRMATEELGALQSLIRPAGFYRAKAERLRSMARSIKSDGGLEAMRLRDTDILRHQLLEHKGIGPETADAILAYAFRRPTFIVDAYARRLFERLNWPRALESDQGLKQRVESALCQPDELNELHALIIAHGKHYCRAQPKCKPCPLSGDCGYASFSVALSG